MALIITEKISKFFYLYVFIKEKYIISGFTALTVSLTGKNKQTTKKTPMLLLSFSILLQSSIQILLYFLVLILKIFSILIFKMKHISITICTFCGYDFLSVLPLNNAINGFQFGCYSYKTTQETF